MKTTARMTFALLVMLILPMLAAADEPALPIKVSDNNRYFVDQNGTPFFWLANSQWQLFHDNTVEEARTILRSLKDHGFTVVQVKLLGPKRGEDPSVYGEIPMNTRDPLVINEMYIQQVDAIVRMAREQNLIVAMTIYHQMWRDLISEKNARGYAKVLGRRYANFPNIVWTSTPEASAEFLPVLRELATGLEVGREQAISRQEPVTGKCLITFKPDPGPHSSSFANDEPWQAFNNIQVWRYVDLIYPLVLRDYLIKPTKPVVMTEGAYEAGTEYKFEVTPLWVRRQAYYSYLAGASHGYGHNDSWRMLPTWKQSLDSPGARQMAILKKIFTDRKEWWNLVPDQDIFATGGKTSEYVLNLAARHKDGLWGLVYLGDKAKFSIDMSKFGGDANVNASWINPRTGEATAIGKLPAQGAKEFSTPDGWEDSLLLLERAGN